MKNLILKVIRLFFRLFLKLLSKKTDTTHLGTPYGGWDFIEDHKLKNTTIISAGAGEDISFDIEFIEKYNSTVIIVDPTPRAIEHVSQVKTLLGEKKSKEYDLETGYQDPKSYNLESITVEQIILIEKALTNSENEIVSFYPPQNPSHVSHSISNYQNNFIKTDNFIEVTTTTVSEIIKEYNIKHIELIKLDIEGAENQVLPHLLFSKILPNQILVEFDELVINSFKPYFQCMTILIRFLFNGYWIVHTNSFPNFLIVKKSLLKNF